MFHDALEGASALGLVLDRADGAVSHDACIGARVCAAVVADDVAPVAVELERDGHPAVPARIKRVRLAALARGVQVEAGERLIGLPHIAEVHRDDEHPFRIDDAEVQHLARLDDGAYLRGVGDGAFAESHGAHGSSLVVVEHDGSMVAPRRWSETLQARDGSRNPFVKASGGQ